ncbi:hypothetical protein LIQ25_12120 [Blautia glucerasea]|uniref:hypothetical protein n=1 Tax=Blautia TaxID=572511 RepID=UPI00156EBD07|nr:MULTISPECIES: hypothetical protein [Blautia]MCB5383187.1 hypothetical protein [Blautia glucerasea]NSJ71000.1 hypothetical protein [Blautia faecis]
MRKIKLKISKDDLTGFRQLTKEEKRNFYRYIRRQTKPYRICKLLFALYVVAIFVMKLITIRESPSSTAPPMPGEIIDTLNVVSYQMLKLIPVLLIIGVVLKLITKNTDTLLYTSKTFRTLPCKVYAIERSPEYIFHPYEAFIITETQSCEDGVLVSHQLQREWIADNNMNFILLKIRNHEDDDYNTEYQLYPEYAIKNAGKN